MPAVANGVIYNTDSGLSAPGGLLDRLTQAMDSRAQYQGMMRGLAPALQANGIPVTAPPSVMDQILGAVGFGSTPQQPQMPVARSSSTDSAGASAPTLPSAGGGGTAPMAFAPGDGVGGLAGNALVQTIGQAAQKYGIDPMTAIKVALAEGGKSGGYGPSGTGDGGSSFSPFQLHYGGVAGGGNAGAGLGDDFTAATHLDARDPKNAAAAIDFALANAAKNGWGAFHGAARAGVGQWDGIGGASSQATAYAPNGGAGDMPRAPAVQALGGAAPMPIATGSPTMRQTPQPGSQPTDAVESATPGQVLGPLMANPATRPIGAQLMQQGMSAGGLPGAISLPAGMTPDALATMISTPQTMQMGLAIWQKSLFPQITSVEPGRAIFAGTRYVGQAPSAPTAVPLDSRLVDPNTGRVIADGSPKLEHAEIGRDAYGQPTYGAFDPRSGQTTPFPGGQSASTATGPDGQPLSGDAFLGTLPPAVAGQVKAIAEGRMKAPSGMGANSPMAQRLRAAVLQYDPSFDQAGVDARFETRGDFAKGDAAKTITAGNTALLHLGELADRIDALGNADSSIPGNNYVNALKNSANATSAAGAPIAAFNAIASKYTEEATKFYRGSGGTEADINRDIANLNANMSPTQLKAAIQAQIPLLQGKIDALQSRWKQGMGAHAADYPIMSPQAQAVIGRLGGQASAGTAPASAGLPIAAPGGSGQPGGGAAASGAVAAPIDQARAALARGAPRAAVIQRLQQMGVNPAGL